MSKRTYVSSLLALGAAILSSSCSASSPSSNIYMKSLLERIESACSLTPGTFVALDDGRIEIKLRETNNPASFECGLQKIKEQIPAAQIGFVGNEQLEPDN